MKYVLVFLGLIFRVQIIHAQQNIDSNGKQGLINLPKAAVYSGIGLEFEKIISNSSVIDIYGGELIGQATDGFSFSKPFARLQLSPMSYLEYRNYYNLFKRLTNNKKISNNAANFIYAKAETVFPVKNQNYFGLLLVQGWGMQRTLFGRISCCLHLGVIEHFYYDKYPNGGFNYIKIEPDVVLSICYTL